MITISANQNSTCMPAGSPAKGDCRCERDHSAPYSPTVSSSPGRPPRSSAEPRARPAGRTPRPRAISARLYPGPNGAGGLAAEQDVLERAHDPIRGLAVAVGIGRLGHLGVGDRIVQQPVALGEDPVGVVADQPQRAGLDALGALGRLAGDQHRLAQRRRLFLDPARVGDHQVGAREQAREGRVAERLGQEHVVEAGEVVASTSRTARVGVQGSTKCTSGSAAGEPPHALGDAASGRRPSSPAGGR